MGFYADKIFPLLLDTFTAGLRTQCQEVVGAARGRVLELGVGTGANLGFYTSQVTEVVGIEPSAALLEKSHVRLQSLQQQSGGLPKIVLRQGSAEHLEFADATFDTVVACLVFCTIPAAEVAAREMYRVLKPGGQVVFFEHVRAPDAYWIRWQNCLNPLWRKLAAGCNLNRDTKRLFAKAGFVYRHVREYYHPALWYLKFCSSIVQGVAVKPLAAT
jgi:ubiquinone/menaquinone biosynthesis C-methylase UbiE